ncbi:MAG: hypothetical protein ACXVB1_08975 [Pseudobdellovibrionaceae bacterium]
MMKVLNEYPGSHHYWENYEKTEYFCPNCGAKDVWEEQGDGDYYVGADLICSNCGAGFTMQGPNISKEQNMILKVKQLKTQITEKPTTKPGR